MDKEKDSPVLYQEDTQTPTNIATTVQAPITKDAEGNILEQYKDPQNDKQYSTTPDTTTPTQESNTGSGLEAALGTDYSWETKAQERAELDYKSKILEAKSNYLTNRQELEAQGIQGQEQIDMQKYSTNQSNEKAGWTGGYILDTERQMAYLKQTIQSQMYGAMELQRYGYDTSLAAARLAYDTNKYDLALEYYNTALSRAVSEAEITGYYVSPEVSEMLNQYSIASSALNKGEDQERNERILDSVYKWFEANGISKQGVETYSHLVEERTHKLAVIQSYEWLDKNKTQLSTDEFAMLDAEGNYIWADSEKTQFKTFNFKTEEPEKILDYISSDKSGTAKQQYYSRLDSIGNEMALNFETYLSTKVKDPKTLDTNSTMQYLKEWLNSTETTTDKLAEEMNRFDNIEHESLSSLFQNYYVTLRMPNGEPVKMFLTVNGENSLQYPNNLNSDTPSGDLNSMEIPDQININNLINSLEKTDYKEYQSNIETIKKKVENERAQDYKHQTGNLALAAVEIVAAVASMGIITLGLECVKVYIDGFNVKSANRWEDRAEDWTKKKKEIESALGENNLNLLKEAHDEYKNMSEEDRNKLGETSKKVLEDAYNCYESYKALNSAIKFAKNRDSSLVTGKMFEYTADRAKQIGEKWDDGYDFGDVTMTAVDSIGLAFAASAEWCIKPIAKAGKGIAKGIKKGWKKLKKLW